MSGGCREEGLKAISNEDMKQKVWTKRRIEQDEWRRLATLRGGGWSVGWTQAEVEQSVSQSVLI
jgi:hypothetical protein